MTYKEYRSLSGHEDRINDIKICSNCETLLSASDDKKIIIWDLV